MLLAGVGDGPTRARIVTPVATGWSFTCNAVAGIVPALRGFGGKPIHCRLLLGLLTRGPCLTTRLRRFSRLVALFLPTLSPEAPPGGSPRRPEALSRTTSYLRPRLAFRRKPRLLRWLYHARRFGRAPGGRRPAAASSGGFGSPPSRGWGSRAPHTQGDPF